MRLRLDVGYDGTEFSGWATQPGRRTVQEVLEDALRTVLRHPVRVTCAGRTDAGVHARGQVCHTDVPDETWATLATSLLVRLAGVLPPDLRVRAVAEAPAGFDARFSATLRRYAYRVADTPYGVDPLLRRHVLWHRRPLDLGRMNEAAVALLGEHDFAAFCRPREGATTVRTLRALSWARRPDGVAEGTVEADAFCHNMVRALVGALLVVGDGSRPVDWPASVLASRTRGEVQVVPPHGLTLESVGYPPAGDLAVQAERARRRRELAS